MMRYFTRRTTFAFNILASLEAAPTRATTQIRSALFSVGYQERLVKVLFGESRLLPNSSSRGCSTRLSYG